MEDLGLNWFHPGKLERFVVLVSVWMEVGVRG